MRETKVSKRSQNNDNNHDDAALHLVKAYVNPNIKQLMGTTILTPGQVNRLASAIAQEAGRDRESRFIFEDDETSPNFGKLIKYISPLSIYAEALMLLNRSLQGKNLEYMTDLTGEQMYSQDYENDLQSRIRQI